MGLPITYSPSTIDFGAVAPGYQNYIELRTGNAPSADNVSSQVTNQSPPGVFRVSKLTVYRWERKDVSGDLPPDKRHGPVWEWGWDEVSENPGTGPIQVDKGCQLGVSVSVVAPPAAATDTYIGTLQITGSVWDPITVPLTVAVRQVRTIFQITSIGVNQGGQAVLPILVDSLAGPPTTVSYSMGSSLSGVSLQTPAQVSVPQGPTHTPAQANLTILATDNADVGTGTLNFGETAFNGQQQDDVQQQRVTIAVHPLPLAASGIEAKYLQLGGTSGILGPPTAPEQFCQDRHAQFRTYANGVIYWSPELGAHDIHSAIFTYFSQLNDNNLAGAGIVGLGYPITDQTEFPAGGFMQFGQFVRFQRGSISWKSSTGPHEVFGKISEVWLSQGGEGSPLGWPLDTGRADFFVRGLPKTARWTNFENGLILDKDGSITWIDPKHPNAQIPGTVPLLLPVSTTLDANKVVLPAIEAAIKAAVAGNPHASFQDGSTRFDDPQHPVTDYSFDGTNVIPRQYQVHFSLTLETPDPLPPGSATIGMSIALAGYGYTLSSTDPWTQEAWVTDYAIRDFELPSEVPDSNRQEAFQTLTAALEQQKHVKHFSPIPLPKDKPIPPGLRLLSVKPLVDGTLALLFDFVDNPPV